MKRISPQQSVAFIIGISAAIRLVLAGSIGLGVDESYVAAVARVFSLSYFDHPPLHLWIVWLTSHLAKSESALILRLPFVLLFAGTTWLMYRLGAKLFGQWTGVYAALILNVSAVFGLSTGSWILPDGPLLFFLLATALTMTDLFFFSTAGQTRRWILSGIFLGFSLLSKYHGVFLVLGTFLFLMTSSRHRFWLRRPDPYLALLTALLIFSPVIVWNQQHHWISFFFQGGRAAATGFQPEKMLINVAGQAVWLLPWIWGPLVWVLGKNILAGPGRASENLLQSRCWFLCCLAVGPVAIFTIATMWGAQGLFHWQAPGYLFAVPLLGRAVTERIHYRAVRWWLQGSVAIFLVIILLLGSHTATGWMRDLEPDWFRSGDPTVEALDWKQLPDYLARTGLLTAENTFVVAGNWIDAGKIDYILGGKLPVLCLSREPHHFAFLHAQADFKGKRALIIGRKQAAEKIVTGYRPYFQHIQPLGTVKILRGGRPEIELVLYQAQNFRADFPLPYGQ
ncbi:dolichyl-phosphate-mannose-protein mannosyltransferase [Lucifera butyrica]|uniref:Dolichyl-phosphate-mannose-protein mannosyltransferase n=1 Tax=Lucifera butyrica TaxID=1351585 RepID=A0A498R6Z0_9FIRM|nr:glycosyltransferase family 39 protein [Lucifera butyrica]VBB05933.1 dolichyl-phosphate-mannose-protein mannosyltransferase [Lucifera butyrica]